MAPATKRRKTGHNVEKYFCFSCMTERVSKQFPRYNPTPDCTHLIHTCTNCLLAWVKAQVESATFAAAGEGEEKVFGIKCPQCPSVMRNVNVETAATKKVYERFEELERKHIADTTPGWRWCMDPSCRAGQVHADGGAEEQRQPKGAKRAKHRKEDAEAQPDYVCVCNKCGAKACVACDRPWHEGEQCSEYQARIKDRVAEEDKALHEIQRMTKPCPTCRKRIEKNGGCPMMHCSQCQSMFCWNCMTVPKQGLCECNRR